MEACYKTLGIEENATIEEAKAAYRQMIKTWHPDRHTGNADVQLQAEEMTKAANLAFEQFVLLSKAGSFKGSTQTSYQEQAANYQWEAFVQEQKNRVRPTAPVARNNAFSNVTSFVSSAIILVVFAVSLLTVQNIQNAHAESAPEMDLPVYHFADETVEAPVVDFRKTITSNVSKTTSQAAGGSVFSVKL